MIAPGTLLQNRYVVLNQIGQGGMGTVYIATDKRFGSTVALKETHFDDPSLRRAFEREARLLNSLRHPALPRVSDHFTEDTGQFLVMEFIPGHDLAEMLAERGEAFPAADVLNWADQLLDALDYLHTQEPPVIHRDIKPQNLKVMPRGQIVLLDFGLAKGTPSVQLSRASATASVFGYSRNYAPLEQIQGAGTDPRSDFYSLAATLYHLLTGTTPPDALTRATAVLNGLPDPLVAAAELRPTTPEPLSAALARALALNAGQRPQTAVAMREMLGDARQTSRPADGEAARETNAGSPANIRSSLPPAADATAFQQQTQLMDDAPPVRTPVVNPLAATQPHAAHATGGSGTPDTPNDTSNAATVYDRDAASPRDAAAARVSSQTRTGDASQTGNAALQAGKGASSQTGKETSFQTRVGASPRVRSRNDSASVVTRVGTAQAEASAREGRQPARALSIAASVVLLAVVGAGVYQFTRPPASPVVGGSPVVATPTPVEASLQQDDSGTFASPQPADTPGAFVQTPSNVVSAPATVSTPTTSTTNTVAEPTPAAPTPAQKPATAAASELEIRRPAPTADTSEADRLESPRRRPAQDEGERANGEFAEPPPHERRPRRPPPEDDPYMRERMRREDERRREMRRQRRMGIPPPR